MDLVRRGFRVWDEATTREKRRLVRTAMTNAAASQLCPDDMVRLFMDWIERYHESHFAVIRAVYKEPGATRGRIWDRIHGSRVREDSAEADLFRMLIRDLSTGAVIRQQRRKTEDGRFIGKRGNRRGSGRLMKSSFDSTDPYELTELGKQFVHYAMNDVVPRIGGRGSR